MSVKSKLPTKCKIFVKIVKCVNESLMTSFLAVFECYHIHEKFWGMLLKKIATNAFSAVGCFLHFSSSRQKST